VLKRSDATKGRQSAKMAAMLSALSDASSLLRWYRRRGRDYPWRRTKDPYAIWVSEVMLQQTRIGAVLQRFPGFLATFPTVHALAGARTEEVLAAWTGLGYYRRAHSLQEAARQIVSAGDFPRTVAGWRGLPGVGAYTAAAVASIAFGVAAVAVDTNVERVFSRYLGLRRGVGSARSKRRIDAAAGAFLVPGRAGDSNQALMELGETVCATRAPRCPECPLAAGCRARQVGDPESYAKPRAARTKERRFQLAVAVGASGRWLLVRRPADAAVLAGAWELPWVAQSATPERALAERYGGTWKVGASLGLARHAITFRQIETEVRLAEIENGDVIAEGQEAGWFTVPEIAGLPRSSLLSKLSRLLPAES
jgi:A/G-specific adenine glycosylase